MKKNILLTLTLMCCSAWLGAQSSPNPSGGSSGSPSQSGTPSGSQTPSGTGQTTSPSNGDMNGNTNGSSNETTISGCLMNSGGSYTITDSSGTQYQLSGDSSKLSSHVNQQVQVKGSASSSGHGASGSAAGSSASGSAGTDSSAGAQATQGTGASAGSGSQMFTVSKVKKISDSCSSSK